MKRIWAVLMAVALLVCLAGCGKEEADKSGAEKPAKAAEAKGPFTFAGVGWDTPIGDCEAALEKGTGVQFSLLEEPDPDDPAWADPLYFWDGASFAAAPGHYTMLGMTIDATGASGTFVPGIAAYYTQPDDGSERKLEAIRVLSNRCDLPTDLVSGYPDWSQLQAAQEVFREVDKRYGENTCVYVLGCSHSDGIMHHYTVPAKEFPYLFQDAFAFAEHMGWEYLCIGLTQDNVDFYIDVSFSGETDSWYYAMNLEYLGYPWAEGEFGQRMAGLAVPFPWVNGEPEYVEIVP